MKKKVKSKTIVANRLQDIASEDLLPLAAELKEDRITKKRREEIAGSLLSVANAIAAESGRIRRFRAGSV
jgi:hypothetical protein